MNDLDNEIAVVTGGSRGIGRGVCLRLAQEGARVAILDISAPDETRAQIADQGGESWYAQTDIADPDSIERAFAQLEADWGVPRALANVAGVFEDVSLFEGDRGPVKFADHDGKLSARIAENRGSVHSLNAVEYARAPCAGCVPVRVCVRIRACMMVVFGDAVRVPRHRVSLRSWREAPLPPPPCLRQLVQFGPRKYGQFVGTGC